MVPQRPHGGVRGQAARGSPPQLPGARAAGGGGERENFLWLGSRGAVLKGLDLVLEAFARMPDLQVSGPVEDEADFAAAYGELVGDGPMPVPLELSRAARTPSPNRSTMCSTV